MSLNNGTLITWWIKLSNYLYYKISLFNNVFHPCNSFKILEFGTLYDAKISKFQNLELNYVIYLQTLLIFGNMASTFISFDLQKSKIAREV